MSAALNETVAAAWRRALRLPAGAAELAKSWEDAGGDSLGLMEMALALETRLGRKIDLALIGPDMDVAAMSAALERRAEPVRAALTVYLLPGQLGDGPSLVRFRGAFEGDLRLELIDLPGLDANAAVLGTMAGTGQAVADEIVRRQPAGAVRLAGYSFGGSVAFEAARALVAMGREVAFLGVLDAAFGPAATGRPPASNFRSAWRWQAHRVVLALLSPVWVRRLVLAMPRTRFFVARRFRTAARIGWAPERLEVPGFLAVSAEFEGVTLPVWTRLLPGARVVHLPGAHYDIFRNAAFEVLVGAFEGAVLGRRG